MGEGRGWIVVFEADLAVKSIGTDGPGVGDYC